jgi:glycolate oxidase iron-sulfur subunit
MGMERAAHAAAKANIAAWTSELEGAGLDAVIVNTSGCGTTLKDYGFMLRDEPEWAARAARIAGLALDISEYLVRLGLGPAGRAPPLTVAYHAACSLQHGQKVTRAPKDLLAAAGFAVVEPAEAHLCCGSAGTYNLLQPAIAGQLRDRKLAQLGRLQADVIAAGNIGCMTQLGTGTATPIVHTVELLDWASGGPRPAALAGLA